VVVEAGMLGRTVRIFHGIRAQIDIRRKELFYERPERVRLRKSWYLVAKLKILKDVLDIR
jgi:hypothetical protein